MADTDMDTLRRELRQQCEARHAEADRRLQTLETLFGQVQNIAVQLAGLLVKVDLTTALMTRMELKIDNFKIQATTDRTDDANRRGSGLVTIVLIISGWAVALLLFILKELVGK